MSPAKDPEEKMKPEEVAEEWKLSLQYLAELRSNGEGPPYYKLGRARNSSVRYVRHEIENWFNQGRVDHSKRSA